MPLEIAITDGELGPVLVLAGETDLATVPDLCRELTAQLATGLKYLTVDLSGLTFADSVSVQALTLAALTLQRRRGDLILLNPQPHVASLLCLLDPDQMLKVQLDTGTEARSEAV